MSKREDIIAVIFDFDDTLTDDSTSLILSQYGKNIDVTKFWTEDVDQLIKKEGWDLTFAWLHLFLKNIEKGRLPRLTNKDLQDIGKTLKPYPGLKGLFRDLREIATNEKVQIEFYIISGGLQDVIEGFPLRQEFNAVWGCQLAPGKRNGVVKYIKRAITFTEKTRYLFEINKGINYDDASSNPYLVNKDIPKQERRIPFPNMFYVGDGLSDIPCFSLITNQSSPLGRKTFGVFHPGKSVRKAWLELIAPQRVVSAHAPKYGPKQDLGAMLRAAVQSLCTELNLAKT